MPTAVNAFINVNSKWSPRPPILNRYAEIYNYARTGYNYTQQLDMPIQCTLGLTVTFLGHVQVGSLHKLCFPCALVSRELVPCALVPCELVPEGVWPPRMAPACYRRGYHGVNLLMNARPN